MKNAYLMAVFFAALAVASHDVAAQQASVPADTTTPAVTADTIKQECADGSDFRKSLIGQPSIMPNAAIRQLRDFESKKYTFDYDYIKEITANVSKPEIANCIFHLSIKGMKQSPEDTLDTPEKAKAALEKSEKDFEKRFGISLKEYETVQGQQDKVNAERWKNNAERAKRQISPTFLY